MKLTQDPLAAVKNILVIGGTLYIGKRLVRRLIDQGHKVTICSRGLTPDDFGSAVDRIVVDRQNPQAFVRQLNGTKWDVVFDHLCFTEDDALNAVSVFKENVDHYIMLSSQSVYRRAGLSVEADFRPEEYTWNATTSRPPAAEVKPINNGRVYTGSRIPDWLSYGESKRRAEAVIAKEFASRALIVRIPMVLGIDDPTKRLRIQFERIEKNQAPELPAGGASVQVVDADSVADFLRWSMEKKIVGTINYASLGLCDPREVIRQSLDLLQKRAEILRPPATTFNNIFWCMSIWQMDCSRAVKLGFPIGDVNDWLPKLVEEICSEITRKRLVVYATPE